jgi:hypothetical protein
MRVSAIPLAFAIFSLPALGSPTKRTVLGFQPDCNQQAFESNDNVIALVNDIINSGTDPVALPVDSSLTFTNGNAVACIGNAFFGNHNTHFSNLDWADAIMSIVFQCDGGGGNANTAVTGDTGITLEVSLTNTDQGNAACPFVFVL